MNIIISQSNIIYVLGAFHGRGGELYVGRVDYTPTSEYFFDAVLEKGYPVGDLNAGQFPGMEVNRCVP